MTRLRVIYVPGVGDTPAAKHLKLQKWIVRNWRWWGVNPEQLPMHWSDDEPWESKLQRLLLRIDTLHANGYPVALVGASAGAAAVVTAYAARQKDVVGVVTICGKINRPESISRRYSEPYPALLPAVQDCQKALQKLGPKQRQRIQSRRALYDGVVKKADNYVEGATHQTAPSIGHGFTIGAQLIFGAPSFIRFLKAQVT